MRQSAVGRTLAEFEVSLELSTFQPRGAGSSRFSSIPLLQFNFLATHQATPIRIEGGIANMK
jgi:hypothetical protein